MPKRILFVTSFSFPDHDAGATRTTMLARALMSRGHEVELCGIGDRTLYQGIPCHTLNPHHEIRVLNALAYHTLGVRALAFVRCHLRRFDTVIASFLPSNATEAIKRLCHRSGKVFGVDSTEWFTPDEFDGGESDRGYIDHVRLLTEVIDPSVKVICISKYLEHYFVTKGCEVLRVPAVLDTNALATNRSCSSGSDRTTIMYAGSPGKKDSIWVILEAVSLLSPAEQNKLHFVFYGLTEDDLKRYGRNLCPLPKCIAAHGRVPRNQVIAGLCASDFTVLMRDPSKRFAKAGMPTKVTESLGSGVPVIANITSDLGGYLEDDVNSIVVGGYSANECADAFRRAAKIPRKSLEKMRAKARATAREELDFRVYADAIDAFLFGEE